MTKAEKLRRAREVKECLAFFVSWQSRYMQEYLKEQGRDPAQLSLGQLLAARGKLDALIEDVRAEAQ
jgi:hypothetical protein